ncbi:hypothetical protein [Pseudomonas sp. NPDC089741]|uniref:hypothetical protein n=1 Tax=Pseudomonas sp. NPDC089741 TaxID=3364470 RepID=UPI00382DB444
MLTEAQHLPELSSALPSNSQYLNLKACAAGSKAHKYGYQRDGKAWYFSASIASKRANEELFFAKNAKSKLPFAF